MSDPHLIPFLLEFGAVNPDFVDDVVERRAGDLLGDTSKRRSRRRVDELYEELVRSHPEAVSWERRHNGLRKPVAVSRGKRVARAWAEVEARNEGKRRV